MARSNVVNFVKDKFFNDVSAPDIKQLWFEDKRIDNGFEVNNKVVVIAKEASERCTKDSYIFNFDPTSMLQYKELASVKEVIFAMRCANDDRFCVIHWDELSSFQQKRGAALKLDELKQLIVKVDIVSSKGFSASVSGGGRSNPIGTLKKGTGLLTSWVKKLIRK